MKAIFAKVSALIILVPLVTAHGQQRIETKDVPGSQSIRTQERPEPVLQTRFPRYRLRPGDVLELNFGFTPEFNQTITVQPDGYVILRGLSDLHVQDKTVPEATAAMRLAYSSILRDPVLTVELKEFEKPYFIVGGEIARPGKYDLRGDTTILEAVAMAGDLKPQSKSSQVLLFRRVSSDLAEVKQVDIKQMLRRQNLSEDLHLQPGDMVYVPKTRWAKFDRFIPVPSLGAFFNPLSF